MVNLVYRHNRITRLTHWINAVALLILFMSGLQIFNAFPELHWGSKAEPKEAFFSITATQEDGAVRGYTQIFGFRFDTTGVLGIQNTEMGPSARAFPGWITIPSYFWLAGGRRWHFFFAWVFTLNGLLYFIYNVANGHMRKFLFTPEDTAKVPAMILYYLHLRRNSPQEGDYNPLQKLAYTSVFVIFTPLVLLTGMAMSPQLDVAFHWLPAMFGGRQSARSVHFILAFAFALFTFGHVFMVLATGFLNNMRSMVTGWHKETVPAPTPSVAMDHPPMQPPEPPAVTEDTEAAASQAISAQAPDAPETSILPDSNAGPQEERKEEPKDG
jgi:Ni/Fe-hydrogenase b-type cytochrome subunit